MFWLCGKKSESAATINEKEVGFLAGAINHFLVFCTLSVQLTRDEKKDEVIRRLAEMVTKAQLQDNAFLDNLVKTVKHGDLNVTTKVNFLLLYCFLIYLFSCLFILFISILFSTIFLGARISSSKLAQKHEQTRAHNPSPGACLSQRAASSWLVGGDAFAQCGACIDEEGHFGDRLVFWAQITRLILLISY